MTRNGLPPPDRRRFEFLLPWYANGTLGAEDRREMERCLASSAECRADLDEMRALARILRSESVVSHENHGLDRLMAMVHAQAADTVAAPASKRDRTFPHMNVVHWNGAALTILGLIALIGVGTMSLPRDENGSALDPSTLSLPADTKIQATFRADASDMQIRELLAKAGAEIIGGPGGNGTYTLKVTGRRVATVLLELRRATNIVDKAAPAANL